MTRRATYFSIGLVLVILVTAIPLLRSRTTQGPISQMSSTQQTNNVTIRDYAFDAPSIEVKVGTTVTWTNQDAVRHNIVADDPSPNAPNGPLLSTGESYSFTFTEAGTYPYHCMPHSHMKGTVTVIN